MLIAFFILFIALCPGVLFTAPSLGKGLGGNAVIATIHGLVFIATVNFLNVVVEAFQTSMF